MFWVIHGPHHVLGVSVKARVSGRPSEGLGQVQIGEEKAHLIDSCVNRSAFTLTTVEH